MGAVPGACGSPAQKCQRLQIAGRQKRLAWKAVAQPHLPTAVLAQRHRDWDCLLVLPPKTCLGTSNFKRSLWGLCRETQAALLRKCECLQIAGSQKGLAWKAVAQPHLPNGTAHTEAQRLGLLACLATSNFKRSLWVPCRETPAALLQKCECLQIAGSEKGLPWKALAQPHLPTALLAQRHRDWGCLLVLPPQTSDVSCKWTCE